MSSSSLSKCPTSFSNSNLISFSTSCEAESKSLPPAPLSIASSNNISPEPEPVIVPLSNSQWIAILPVSGAKPPFTTATFASAVPELNVSVSNSWKPVPAALTITSSTPAPVKSWTWIRAPAPAPPDTVASSPTVSVAPAFVIVVDDTAWLTESFMIVLGY